MDESTYMAEITRPHPRLFPAFHTEIHNHLQILFCQNLARPRLVDIRLGLAVC